MQDRQVGAETDLKLCVRDVLARSEKVNNTSYTCRITRNRSKASRQKNITDRDWTWTITN